MPAAPYEICCEHVYVVVGESRTTLCPQRPLVASYCLYILTVTNEMI